MRRRWVTVTSLLGAFTVATLAYTWPIPAYLDSAYVYTRPSVMPISHADSYLTSWMLAWGGHALRTAPLRIFDANIFYPIRDSLAFSEHMLGAVVQILPVDTIGRSPVLDHNVLLLLSYVLTGVGSALLLLELGTSMTAAVVGGALATFGPWRLGYLDHVNLIANHWMPFTWLFLHRLLRTARWGAGVGFAVSLILQSLTSVYHAYYFGVAVGVLLVLHVAWRLPAARGAYLRTTLFGVLVALALAPTFVPYLVLKERFGLGRSAWEVFWFSALGEHFLGAFMYPLRWLQSRFMIEGAGPNGAIGWGTGFLCIGAVVLGGPRNGRRPATLYLTLALIIALLSLGPTMHLSSGFAPGIPGPYPLLSFIPGWDALRCPGRASMSSFLAVAILAGLGADAVLARLRSRHARAVAAAILALIVLVDCWRTRFYVWVPPLNSGQWAAHDWVAAHAPGVPILELPLGSPEWQGAYMVLSSRDWNPLVNGHSGFDPAGPYLRGVFFRFPDPDSLRLLADLKVGLVIVHDDLRPGPICLRLEFRPMPYLSETWSGQKTCILRVLGAPPAPPTPSEQLVALAGARLTGSAGDSAAAAGDGDLATHWMQDIVPTADGWLQIDLPEPHPVRRIRLRLGPHYGDYPRHYRVDASTDGVQWAPLTPVRLAEPPLRGLLHDSGDLSVDLEIPVTSTAHLRVVRPARTKDSPVDLFSNWLHWGVHEVELYEAADS